MNSARLLNMLLAMCETLKQPPYDVPTCFQSHSQSGFPVVASGIARYDTT